ncbi:hypothetical protein [Nocardiopsis sp. CC223A]|uniref:hypothetical protein n=1 Tax=Nocardiopsis sp. CC223A TaxID=3044051 RepID=UPI0027960F46|nr:hypothetical protein [Nocardiopsis sp. CC223A]
MKTRVPALFTAGVLALSLAACGSEESPEPTEEATEAAAEENGGGGGLTDLLATLSESTAEVGNYTLDIDGSMSDPDSGEPMPVTMSYQVMDDPQAVKIEMDMPFYGEMMVQLLELGGTLPDGVTAEDLSTVTSIATADDRFLLANPHDIYGTGTEWVEDTSGTGGPDLAESFDVSHLPDMVGSFGELEQIEEVGQESVDGVNTTVVAGTLTSEDIQGLSAEGSAAFEALFGTDVAGDLKTKLWVSDEGFPMRLEFVDEATTVQMEFSSVGSTSFELPADDAIGTM